MAPLRRHLCVAVGFAEIQFACRKRLCIRCYRETPILIGFWAVSSPYNAADAPFAFRWYLSNAVGSGPDELPPNDKSYNESAVPSYRVLAARGGDRHAWSGDDRHRPVPLAHPGRTSATGRPTADACSYRMPRWLGPFGRFLRCWR